MSKLLASEISGFDLAKLLIACTINPPKALHKDVVLLPIATVHADGDFLALQYSR